MTETAIWHLHYSIEFNSCILEEDRGFLRLAQEQLRRHHQELNIRSKATDARQSIEYLTKKFIPDIHEQIAALERHIEIRKMQLTGLSYEQAEQFLDENTGQITIEDLAV